MTTVPHFNDGDGALDRDPANASDQRGPWDKCSLGGVTLPGVAEVDVTQGRNVEDRGAPGRNGARLIDRGAEAGTVTITLRIWTAAQLAQLQRSMPSLNYREERITRTRVLGVNEEPTVEEIIRAARASTSPQYRTAQAGTSGAEVAVFRAPTRTETRTSRTRAPLAISHPKTQLAGISLVYVKRIQINGPRDGVLEVRLECLEYNSEVQRQSRAHAPRPRVGAGSALGSTDTGNFVRGTAFDAQPAGNAPATPPSRSNSGPSR